MSLVSVVDKPVSTHSRDHRHFLGVKNTSISLSTTNLTFVIIDHVFQSTESSTCSDVIANVGIWIAYFVVFHMCTTLFIRITNRERVRTWNKNTWAEIRSTTKADQEHFQSSGREMCLADLLDSAEDVQLLFEALVYETICTKMMVNNRWCRAWQLTRWHQDHHEVQRRVREYSLSDLFYNLWQATSHFGWKTWNILRRMSLTRNENEPVIDDDE